MRLCPRHGDWIAEARAWAASRDIPTLLLDVDPAIGLTRPHVTAALSWAG